MANPFDQFDAPASDGHWRNTPQENADLNSFEAAPTPSGPSPFTGAPAAKPNPFDRFDAPEPALPRPNEPETSWGGMVAGSLSDTPGPQVPEGNLGPSVAGGYVPKIVSTATATLGEGVGGALSALAQHLRAHGTVHTDMDKAVVDGIDNFGKYLSSGAEKYLQENSPNVPAGSAKSIAFGAANDIVATVPAMLASAFTGTAAPVMAQIGVTKFGSTFSTELAKNPDDPQAALDKAKVAGAIDTAAAAIGFKAFGYMPFTTEIGTITNDLTGEAAKVTQQTLADIIKNVTLQGVAVQPAISVVAQAAQNVADGKPVTDGLPQAYAVGAIQNTLLLGLTHLAVNPKPVLGDIKPGHGSDASGMLGDGTVIDQPPRGPSGAGQAATIDPQDIHEGDAESPIDTSIIAEGRRIQREALQKQAQASESAAISSRNGWPGMGSRVSVGADYMEPLTGTVHSAFSEPHPDVPGAMADGIQVQLDSGDMLRGFKHDLDAAGITITPQQAQQAGLPLDVATQPTNQPQPQTVAAEQPPSATATQPEIAPAQVPPQSVSQDMAVINGNAAPISAVQQISNSAQSAENTPPNLRTEPATPMQTLTAKVAAARQLPKQDEISNSPAPIAGNGTEQQPAPILKTPRAPLAPSTETPTLEFIRRFGKINTMGTNGLPTKEGQEVRNALKDVPNPGRYIDDVNGKRPNEVLEEMRAQGWFGRNPTDGTDLQELYDRIDKETRNGPQYHPESERGRAVDEKKVQEDSERERADAHDKLDHYIKESKHLFSTSEKAAMHERVDGGFDPESALVEHIERNAVRGIYDRHEEAPDAEYAAAIPHQRGESETDSSARKGVERSAPETRIESGKPQDGVPTPVHPSEGLPEPSAEVKAEPGTAVDGQGKAIPQTVIPGADRSAAQLAAAREAQGHGRATTSVTQKDAGGMFAPKVEEAPDLFGKDDGPKFQAPTRQTDSPEFKRWFGDSKVVDEKGNPVRVYHGTARPDRIGDRFRKTRATSGPMSFFTEDPELASSYSTAKQDTSLYNEDQNYGGWYKVKVGRSAVPIDRLWYHLTPDEQAKIASLAPRVGRDFETGENIILHPEGEKSGLGGYDQHLKEARGNHLEALVNEWLNSGALFNDEAEFSKVLKLAGLDRPVQEDFPHASYPAVLPAYLSIKNPLDTGSIPPAVVDALNRAASRQRRAPESHGADLWAKNSRSAREWMDTLHEGLAKPDSNHAFTSIPDWVTKTLKELGYDGIKDVGGKLSGGKRHNVWIPFEETQVKSATGNRGTFDPNNPRISFSRSKDSIARGTFTDKFDNERPVVAAELRARLNAMGLHDIALKLPDGIEFNDDKMDGAYARKIIAIAMSAENRAGTMDHEAIHAIKDLGLFTKSEWSMLSAKAAKDWRGEFNIDSRYADLSEDARNEEAVAEAFQAWREAPKPAQGFFTRIFNKMRDALSAIRRVLTGRGYETAEDIFAGIERGEVGARERGNSDAAGEAKFSRSEDEREGDHQAAIDNGWDTVISNTARKMGWEGEPTSQAMGLKALLMPKGPEKTELARNARAIKALEDQRANPLGTRQTPVQGDGETKVRGVAQSIADKAAESGHTLEDLPTYDVSHQAPFIERSEKFDSIPANRVISEAVAMGLEPAPHGTTHESMLIAVQRRATREGDGALLLKLATQSKVLSDLTTAGQRISMMQNLDPTSPVAAIKAVQTARATAAKVKGGDLPKAKKDTIKDMMDTINKRAKQNAKGEPMGAAARKLRFKMFLNSVVCK